MTTTPAPTTPAPYVAMRYGRHGKLVHAGKVNMSVPACGTYTRPGSGWKISDQLSDVTCSKCQKMIDEGLGA